MRSPALLLVGPLLGIDLRHHENALGLGLGELGAQIGGAIGDRRRRLRLVAQTSHETGRDSASVSAGTQAGLPSATRRQAAKRLESEREEQSFSPRCPPDLAQVCARSISPMSSARASTSVSGAVAICMT
jgi:hypothetical protein